MSTLTALAHAENLGFDWDDIRAIYRDGKTTHALEIDNDSFLVVRDSDGFYTSGLRYSQRYALHRADQLAVVGWQFGQEQYTASDIKILPGALASNDHPYAAWLYVGAFKELHHADGSSWKLGLDIGCIGPCAGGERGQDMIHRIGHYPLPQSWSTQIKNEVGAILYGSVSPVRWHPSGWLDVTPYANGRFGNIYADASGGVVARAGALNLLPDGSTLHAFFRVDARAVAYNASLQGGYFSNDNIHTVQPKRFVGEAELGFARNDGPFSFRASVVRRSTEIRGLSNAIGAQSFARLLFAYTM
ncbi:lipid A-modifier LpxR family protein [Undibacterium arcticum]|uniref:Lipid A-modifier LpxR family protein n=1 Tax=Undibacterium arcticum TaxID=1762892 RepID=A0ABV7F5Y8_9BURK